MSSKGHRIFTVEIFFVDPSKFSVLPFSFKILSSCRVNVLLFTLKNMLHVS